MTPATTVRLFALEELAAQERAARSSSALAELPGRTHFDLTGQDRATFLHNFCTQEIRKLLPGQGTEAFITTVKGRILAHVLVFAGAESLWLDAAPGLATALRQHLERYIITEDVVITDWSDQWTECTLIGPQAGSIADQLLPGAACFQPGQHGHHDGITVRRWNLTALPGWLVGGTPERISAVRAQCLAAGAVLLAPPVFDALRIAAGFPESGRDLTDDNLAHEAGRTRQAISFTKGCYLGQEPIARLEALGHANRQLAVLHIDGSMPAHTDTRLVTESGQEAGRVTSAGYLPDTRQTVALALVRREYITPGTRLQLLVETPNQPVEHRTAEVVTAEAV